MVKTSRRMPPTPVVAPWYGSMKLGWLWLSILNTTAWPPPISITPAFSPGPWITHGALVGRPRRWMREDLYEQCSFHIAEKIPSSVNVGTRPISFRMRSYSSGLRPCDATSSGVIWGSLGIMQKPLPTDYGAAAEGVNTGRALKNRPLRKPPTGGGHAQNLALIRRLFLRRADESGL